MLLIWVRDSLYFQMYLAPSSITKSCTWDFRKKSSDCAVGIYCHQFSKQFYFSEITICGHTLSVIMNNLIKIVSLSFVFTPGKELPFKKEMILSILKFMCKSTRRRVKFFQICPFWHMSTSVSPRQIIWLIWPNSFCHISEHFQ